MEASIRLPFAWQQSSACARAAWGSSPGSRGACCSTRQSLRGFRVQPLRIRSASVPACPSIAEQRWTRLRTPVMPEGGGQSGTWRYGRYIQMLRDTVPACRMSAGRFRAPLRCKQYLAPVFAVRSATRRNPDQTTCGQGWLIYRPPPRHPLRSCRRLTASGRQLSIRAGVFSVLSLPKRLSV